MMGVPLHLFPHLLDWLQPISDGLTLVSQQNTLISPACSKINCAQTQLFTDTHSKIHFRHVSISEVTDSEYSNALRDLISQNSTFPQN